MIEDASLEQRFLECVMSNPVNVEILRLAPALGLADWQLTAGALFQSVWNVLDDRDPGTAIRDYDLFYFDPDTSYEAEDAIIREAAALFANLPAEVEVRNEARVHLWYEEHFGVAAQPFTSTHDAIDHFASTTCCFGLTSGSDGHVNVYAPHGYRDLFDRRIVPNPVLAPRSVYEAKCLRWKTEWPDLVIEPWPILSTR